MATILVVDDHSVHQRMYSYTLRKHGHKVLLANHGQDALDQLATTPVDLIVTDLAMPVMDGLMLLKELRGDERYKELPIIILTANGQDNELLAAGADSANALLTKPTSSRELIETAHTLLGGRIIGG